MLEDLKEMVDFAELGKVGPFLGPFHDRLGGRRLEYTIASLLTWLKIRPALERPKPLHVGQSLIELLNSSELRYVFSIQGNQLDYSPELDLTTQHSIEQMVAEHYNPEIRM